MTDTASTTLPPISDDKAASDAAALDAAHNAPATGPAAERPAAVAVVPPGSVDPDLAPVLLPLPQGKAEQGTLSDDELAAVWSALDAVVSTGSADRHNAHNLAVIRQALPPLPASELGIADSGTPVHDSTGDVPVDVKGQPIAGFPSGDATSDQSIADADEAKLSADEQV